MDKKTLERIAKQVNDVLNEDVSTGQYDCSNFKLAYIYNNGFINKSFRFQTHFTQLSFHHDNHIILQKN